MATPRGQQLGLHPATSSRIRWLVGVGLAIAIVVAVVLFVVYGGGGGSGGGGY